MSEKFSYLKPISINVWVKEFKDNLTGYMSRVTTNKSKPS